MNSRHSCTGDSSQPDCARWLPKGLDNAVQRRHKSPNKRTLVSARWKARGFCQEMSPGLRLSGAQNEHSPARRLLNSSPPPTPVPRLHSPTLQATSDLLHKKPKSGGFRQPATAACTKAQAARSGASRGFAGPRSICGSQAGRCAAPSARLPGKPAGSQPSLWT